MLTDKMQNCISQNDMLQGVSVLLCALSGGADSIAMTHALLQLCRAEGITLNAVHLNHSLRGEESQRDADFVRDFCEKHLILLHIYTSDVALLAKEEQLSIELAARNERYRVFADCAEKIGADAVATAHTASDNLETVLMNLGRGTALSGLCGIPPTRELVCARRCLVIRPLLSTSRSEVLSYLAAHSLPYVLDSTNEQPLYARNRVRQLVIPPLLAEYSGAESGVFAMCERLRSDALFLDSAAERAFSEAVIFKESGLCRLSRERLLPLPYALLSRVLQKGALFALPSAQDGAHIRALAELLKSGAAGARLSLCGGEAELTQGALILKSGDYAEKPTFCAAPLSLGKTILEAGRLVATADKPKLNNLLNINSLDCARIKGNLVLRGRLAGDSLTLAKGHTVTLKKIFIDRKIERDLRRFIPVICDDEGVVWTPVTGGAKRCVAALDAVHTITLEFMWGKK